MKLNMTFQERAKLAQEILSKQPPVTLEQARAQVEKINKRIAGKDKKKR